MGKSSEKNTLALPAVATISAVADIRQQFEAAIDASNRLTVNAEAVERITTPGFQLLFALEKSLKDAGGSLTVQEPSEAFVHAAADLGFSEKLSEWRG